jgi:phosphoglycerol transferase MdoB-like AlkP superfamily enzyme
MSSKKLLGLSGTAGIASAACGFAGALTATAATLFPVIPALSYAILFMAANVLLIFLLMGIYGCQIEESGRTGLVGFVLAVIGLLLALARFFSPLGWLLFLIGVYMLSLANTQAGKVRPWAMWLWTVAILISIGLPYAGIWPLTLVLCPLLNACAKFQIGRDLRSLAAGAPKMAASLPLDGTGPPSPETR